MNKRTVTAFAILMGLVLTCLVVIQVYWIRNAMILREAQFNTAVGQALDEVSNKLEKQDAFSFLSTRFDWMRQSTVAPSPNFMNMMGRNPGMVLSFDQNISLTDTNAKAFKQLLQVINDQEEEEIELEEGRKGIFSKKQPETGIKDRKRLEKMDFLSDIRIGVDTVVEVDTLGEYSFNSKIKIQMDDSVHTFNVNSNTLNGLEQTINKSLNQFSSHKGMFSDLFFDFLQTSRSPLERIDTAEIEFLLKEELAARGIHTPFEYNVHHRGGRPLVTSVNFNGNSYPERTSVNAHQVSLFGSDMFSQPLFLSVQFPAQDAYIFQSLGTMSITSMVLILAISLCFAYTIYIIFRQKKLSDMKTDFINNMTHELKTPIATISLASEMLTNPTIAADEQKRGRFAGIIHDENKRLGGQVERVLQMAVLDKGDFKLKKQSVNVHELLQQVMDQLSLQLETREGEVHTQLEATQVFADADKVHFTNVLFNLLDNAIKYSKETPNITITTKDVANGIFISVKDKGIGMNKESQKRVFEKFYRVPTGNIHDVKGFGLGLSYVKLMVEAHGGTVHLQSELGKGSTFELTLPTYNNNKNETL